MDLRYVERRPPVVRRVNLETQSRSLTKCMASRMGAMSLASRFDGDSDRAFMIACEAFCQALED